MKNQWFSNDFCVFQGLVVFVVLEPVLERFRSQLGAILEPYWDFGPRGGWDLGFKNHQKPL